MFGTKAYLYGRDIELEMNYKTSIRIGTFQLDYKNGGRSKEQLISNTESIC